MMSGIRAEQELVDQLNAVADELEISRSEAVRRALQLFLDAPPEEQHRDSAMEELVRRLVDERLEQRGLTANAAA